MRNSDALVYVCFVTDLPVDFACPECQARYKLVRVPSQSRPPSTTVGCLDAGIGWLPQMAKTF
jgi:hypothetical protein